MTRWSESDYEKWKQERQKRDVERREEVNELVQQSRARRQRKEIGASIQMSEDDLHRAVAMLLNLVLGPSSIWFHVPNEGKRTKSYAGRLKAVGMMAGVPDITIIAPDMTGCRIGDGGTESLWLHYYIELKTPGRKLTPKQKEFRRFCNATNIPYAVCRSLADVEEQLREWRLWK